MKINPNLRYCEHSYWCKAEEVKDNDCYLGWEAKKHPEEYKAGGLYCHNVYAWKRNISGFELIVKISLYKNRRANGKKKRECTEIC